MKFLFKSGRAVALTLALTSAAGVAACDSLKTNLLEAPNPSIIDPSSVQSAAGATAVRNGALSQLRAATADGESSWMFGGLLADEWGTSSTFVQNDETDQRSTQLNNGTVNTALRVLYRVRTSSNQAIVLLKTFKPQPSADIGEMYFARGFAELQLASDFCNGIPLSDGAGDVAVFGQPLPVKDVFAAAVASFDSAMANSIGTDAASISINSAARIGKARALLGIGVSNAPAAAALVTAIPTTFRYDVTASLTGGNFNTLWDQAASQGRYTVSDSLQGNGRTFLVKNATPFLSAKDSRVPARYKLAGNGRDSVKAQDGNTYLIYVDSLWGQTSAVALTHGLDARLIEAEAALAAGNPAQMLTILNTLRATPIQITAPSPQASGTHPGWTSRVMAPLTDPGTAVGRSALLFREKAFWQFGRGHRLGDLRRLIRDYGRAADGSDTFPVGQHYKGGVFGPDVNLPVTTSEQIGNPNFASCIDRKA
jgi:hypothetical protein